MQTVGPLDGTIILDLSQLVQGPFATQIMGDMGADVLKVEPPGGDWLRRFAVANSYPGGESISFLSFNRNKRSIAVDVKNREGREIVLALAMRADVLVENFRPGVMQRLGLGYEELSAANSRLVYCASSGYGQTGPYAARPGQDLLIQAVTGLTLLNGRRDDPPVPVGLGIADMVAGLHIVYGVLAALVRRATTGEGQRVDVSLLNSLLALQTQELTAHLNGASLPARHRTASSAPYVGPPFGIYQTTDGFIAIAMNPMDVLGPLLGLPSEFCVAEMNVEQDAELLFDLIGRACASRSTAQWMETLVPSDIWCAPVQDYAAVEVDPQVQHNEMIQSYEHARAGAVRTVGPAVGFSDASASIRRPAPQLGEHTREILQGVLGRSEEDISRLIRDGAVRDAS